VGRLLIAAVLLGLLLLPGGTATGARPVRYPWPFAPSGEPHPVANLFHTPLRPGTPKAYFHGGIDIRKPRGTPVLAVADGTVRVYREGAFDNLVLTQANGQEWEYRHLGPDSVPAAVRKAEKEKTDVAAGTVIGEVGAWDGPYDHLHLNRRDKDGKIRDPLFELIPVKDTVPTRIRAILFVRDGDDEPIEPGPDGVVTVSGKVDVVLDAIDRMDGETWGNPPALVHLRFGDREKLREYRPFVGGLPLEPVRPVPRYPRGDALCVYLMTGPLACVNRIPGDPKQRFSVVVTNVGPANRPNADGCWDTTKTPDGDVTLSVRTRDHGGNWSERKVTVRVANGR
jgi:murein DD-endopeptidase MepM/ murein hydrolase activator NlpD